MKSHPMRALSVCFVMVTGLFMAACNKQQATADLSDPSGSYVLISVNGLPLPASVSHGGATMQVRSGTFTINPGGTCSSKIILVPPMGTEVAREVSATYIKEGSTLTMQWKDAGKTVGTLNGKIFTMENEGMSFVYWK